MVLDIRAMKQAALLYAPEGENPGKWMQLNSATFRGEKGTAVPELRVFAALREVQPEPGEFDAPAAGVATKIDIRESVAVSDAPEIGGDSPRASRAEPTRAGAKDDDLAGIAKALGAADGDDDEREEPLHLFSITSEVRSFKSTPRMPVPTRLRARTSPGLPEPCFSVACRSNSADAMSYRSPALTLNTKYGQ